MTKCNMQSWWEDFVNERKEKVVTQEKQGEWKSKLSGWSRWERASGSTLNGKQQHVFKLPKGSSAPCHSN